ncbi:MAG: restriction endonuclease subunit S [Catenibacterium mitsuokai]|nr:restriction endonuclease subunit S [Catenibacterium mitsuokai]MEE0335065.1 restriction endonuclease subunit S [Catenibacterium mitsuokai]
MESYIDELRKQSIGGVIKYIKLKNLTDALIELPSIEVQRKIVNIISKSKEIVRRKENEFELLDELVRARFVEMFGNPANNPYNFSKMKLGKICDVRDGTHDSPKYQTVGYPLITSKNLTSGEIDFSNCNYIKEEDYKKINLRSEVTRGDIIMPMIGTIGNPIIVNTDIRFAIKNVALIKFNNNTLQNIYVKYFLGSDYFDFSVLRNIRGGTQKFIALKDLRDLDILVPPLELQNQFASFVQEIDKSRLLSNHLLFLIKSISSNH